MKHSATEFTPDASVVLAVASYEEKLRTKVMQEDEWLGEPDTLQPTDNEHSFLYNKFRTAQS